MKKQIITVADLPWTREDTANLIPERLTLCLARAEENLNEVVLNLLRLYVEDIETDGV